MIRTSHSDPGNFIPFNTITQRQAHSPSQAVEVMNDNELRRISCRRDAMEEAGMWFGHAQPPRNRNARRDTLRRIRHLPREEQILAGEQLRREREDRQLRRRTREQVEAEVIRIPDHFWDEWLDRHAAA